VRVLEQWADGRVRQMRVLSHMTKLRVLEQRANAHCHTPFRPRLPCSRVLAQQPKLRVLEQWAKVGTPTATPHSGRGYQSGCLAVTSAPPDTSTAVSGTAGESCHAHWPHPLQAAATMLSGSSTAAKIAGAGSATVGESCHAHCHTPFRPRLPCSQVLAQQPKLRVLEQRAKVATPTATPPSGRGYHALTW